MDVGASFVADAESSVLVKPGEGALDDPTLAAEAGAAWCAPGRDEWCDAALDELLARGFVFVAAVAEHGLGSARRPAVQSRDRVDERDQLSAVGTVAGG